MDVVAKWLSRRAEAESFASSIAVRLVEALEPRGVLVDRLHSVAFRIKTAAATEKKLRSKTSAPLVNDFIGLRVLSGTLSRLPLTITIANDVLKNAGLVETGRAYTIDRPGAAGYRATHVDYVLTDGGAWSLPIGITVELQITTWLLHFHGALSHRLYYKQSPSGGDGVKALTEISRLAYALDQAADGAEGQFQHEPLS